MYHGKILHQYAKEIKSIHDEGAEICIVIGGGTIFRGVKGATEGMTVYKAITWECWLR